MISYFESMNGKVTEIESCEPGCWIRCIAPTNDEINSLIAEFAIEPDFFRAAMDEEESSHIDIEDESTLLIVDIPVLDRPHEKITYSTTPLGIIITQSIRNCRRCSKRYPNKFKNTLYSKYFAACGYQIFAILKTD